MLYDPKWETTVSPVTKPDILALPTLIAWLEKQPAKKAYCYTESGGCLLAQYFIEQFHGQPVAVGPDDFHWGRGYENSGILPGDFQAVARTAKRTFGAALANARKLATCAETAAER